MDIGLAAAAGAVACVQWGAMMHHTPHVPLGADIWKLKSRASLLGAGWTLCGCCWRLWFSTGTLKAGSGMEGNSCCAVSAGAGASPYIVLTSAGTGVM